MFLYIIESKISDLSTIWTFTAPLNVEEETIRVLKEIAHLEWKWDTETGPKGNI